MGNNETYSQRVLQHYIDNWKNDPLFYIWDKGPLEEMSTNFRILEFPPTSDRTMWTYATSGLSSMSDENPIELHLFSNKRDESLIELLSTVGYYNKNTKRIGLNHTIYFGKKWQDNSICQYGLISLPYIDGPALENLHIENRLIKFFWLIPITKEEVDYKIRYGIEALENKFDERGLDYINPNRQSLV